MAFNFLKKIFLKPEPVVSEKVKLEQLESWLASEKKILDSGEERILKRLEFSIASFISERESGIKTINRIDLNNKKAEEKIKLIVRENLTAYKNHLNKLLETLGKIEFEHIPETLAKINFALTDFDKKSNLSFQKATFLIGKELGDIKLSISRFKKELNQLLEENKKVLERAIVIKNVNEKLAELQENKSGERDIDNQKAFLTEKNKDQEEAIKILTIEAEAIKKSQKYLEQQKKSKEKEQENEELKRNINKLRENIEFKRLAAIFHVNEKKMKQVKDYSENFSASLEQDSESLINLLQESKVNLELIDKIKEIAKKQQELSYFSEISDIIESEREINKTKEEIKALENEKLKLEKACEKLKEARNLIITELKRQLEKINVYLE